MHKKPMEKTMSYLISIQEFNIQQSDKSVFKRTISAILKWIKTIKRWSSISQQRHALLNLSDEQLEDINISREQAIAEAKKAFWQ